MPSHELRHDDRGPLVPEIGLSLSPEVEFTEAEALVGWLRENAVAEVECRTPDFAGYNADADLMLRPDLPTCRAVPWAPDPSVQIIHDVCDRRGRLVEFAPRSVLRRVLALYEKQGWRPVVAPEIEFYLTKPNTDPDYPLEPQIGRSGRVGAKRHAYTDR